MNMEIYSFANLVINLLQRKKRLPFGTEKLGKLLSPTSYSACLTFPTKT